MPPSDAPPQTAQPVLCLITDRRRLAAACHRPFSEAIGLLLEQITGAVRGGIDLVQIREHDLESGALASLARSAVAIAQGTRTRVLVNDRIDVALAVGAAGVHLRETSIATARARALLPGGSLLGRSVHDAGGVTRAGAVDYLVAGTVFPTISKSQLQSSLGLRGLEQVAAAAAPTPVLAIGGVTFDRTADLIAHGAAGLAAIGAFIPSSGAADLADALEKVVTNLRFSFDTSAELP